MTNGPFTPDTVLYAIKRSKIKATLEVGQIENMNYKVGNPQHFGFITVDNKVYTRCKWIIHWKSDECTENQSIDDSTHSILI